MGQKIKRIASKPLKNEQQDGKWNFKSLKLRYDDDSQYFHASSLILRTVRAYESVNNGLFVLSNTVLNEQLEVMVLDGVVISALFVL